MVVKNLSMKVLIQIIILLSLAACSDDQAKTIVEFEVPNKFSGIIWVSPCGDEVANPTSGRNVRIKVLNNGRACIHDPSVLRNWHKEVFILSGQGSREESDDRYLLSLGSVGNRFIYFFGNDLEYSKFVEGRSLVDIPSGPFGPEK